MNRLDRSSYEAYRRLAETRLSAGLRPLNLPTPPRSYRVHALVGALIAVIVLGAVLARVGQ